MKKYLPLVFVSALFANNCMAMEISDGKLISHKEWFSEKATGFFLQHAKNPPTQIKHKLRKMGSTDSTIIASVFSKVSDTPDGKVGDTIEINGMSSVYIQNFNNADQQYTIYTELCTYPKNALDPVGCMYSEDVVVLKPQEFTTLYKYPVLNVSFQQPDTYDIWLITDVWAENSMFQDNQNGSVKIS